MLSRRLTLPRRRKDDQTVALRGSKSRNKVSVGQPAEGSLKVSPSHNANFNLNPRVTCVYVSLGLLACLRSVVKLLLTGVATRSAPCPMTAPAVLSSSPFPFPGMAVGNPVQRFFFSNNRTLNRSDNPNTQPCSGSIGLGVDEERS